MRRFLTQPRLSISGPDARQPRRNDCGPVSICGPRVRLYVYRDRFPGHLAKFDEHAEWELFLSGPLGLLHPARPYFLVVANPQSDNDSVAAFLAPYNTAFLTDQQLRDRTGTRAEIQAFLAQYRVTSTRSSEMLMEQTQSCKRHYSSVKKVLDQSEGALGHAPGRKFRRDANDPTKPEGAHG